MKPDFSPNRQIWISSKPLEPRTEEECLINDIADLERQVEMVMSRLDAARGRLAQVQERKRMVVTAMDRRIVERYL